MDIKDILARVDHTLLKTTATPEEIRALVEDGIKYKVASVCIPPCYVRFAADIAAGRLPICTVTGFPNGYSTAAAKAQETADAVENGADEIDVVLNVGFLKARELTRLEDELKAVRAASEGKILKVIIETCLLTEEEKLIACKLVTASGADFIKTSTGFSTGGATLDDVKLLKANVGAGVRVKAAGGIKTLADAENFIMCGAARLGTSAIVKIIKEG